MDNPDRVPVTPHVHRVVNRLGWCDTKRKEKTADELEAWGFPKEEWVHFLHTFGRLQYCMRYHSASTKAD